MALDWFVALATPPTRRGSERGRGHNSERGRGSIDTASQVALFQTLVPPTVFLDRWFAPLSMPVRVRPRLSTGDQQFLALVKAQPFPGEPINEVIAMLTNQARTQVFTVEMYPGLSVDRIA